MAEQPAKWTPAKRKRTIKGAASGKKLPKPATPKSEPPASTAPESVTEKLLAAANAASGPARNAWLAFLGLLAYLLVTLAGINHENLLLNSPIELPIVKVEIPLFSFFVAAPFLFVLIHLSLLVQHAVLAHKYQHYFRAIAVIEESDARDHPDRRLVHNYVFSQLLAGPKLPLLLQILMRLMVFVTFSLLPVFVLLNFQITFLPYHDVATTHFHRLAILLDLILLFSVRPFYAMPYLRPKGRKLGFGNKNWTWKLSYWSLAIAGSLSLVVMSFSLLVATVPQGCFWPAGKQNEDCFSLDTMTAEWAPRRMRTINTKIKIKASQDVFAPTAWLFGFDDPQGPSRDSSRHASWQGPFFHRNLQLSEATLVREGPSVSVIASYLLAGKTEEDAFTDLARRLGLGGRDLRYADLRAVRFYKADLRRAQLRGANLYRVKLQGADLRWAQLQGADLGFAQLQGANLRDTQLQGANLVWADLQGANLQWADLQGAGLQWANLQGANLLWADLQGANLTGAKLQGAFLAGAHLQGANLRDTQLQGADLAGANLQGAELGADPLAEFGFHSANLQGADLKEAQLQGADLRFAQLQGADLRGAGIWRTEPPGEAPRGYDEPKPIHLADLTGIEIVPLSKLKRDALRNLIDEITNETLKAHRQEKLRPLLSTEADQEWKISWHRKVWGKLSNRRKPNPADLSDFLVELACKGDTGGHIAEGIAARGLETDLDEIPNFNGDATRLAKGLTKKSCGPATKLDDEIRIELCKLAKWPKEDIEETVCAP